MSRLTVVPSRRAAAAIVDGTATGEPGPGGARATWTGDVVTLPDLLDRILIGVSAPDRRLSGVALGLFMQQLMSNLEPAVRRLFGPAVEGPGAVRSVGAAIAGFRMAGLTATDLVHASSAAPRLRGLAAVLDAYERELARGGWRDDAEAYRHACRRVERDEWPAGVSQLEVRGLYDVTRLQAELLTTIARKSARVRIHVPFDPAEPEPAAYAYPYIHMWESVTDPELDIDLVYPDSQDAGAPTVAFTAAAGPADEVRLAADWIRRAADAGCPLESIGVVTPSEPRYLALIDRSFTRRGLVFSMRLGTQLVDTQLFAAAVKPFRLMEEAYRRADLQTWIASPLTTRLDAQQLLPAIARGPAGAARPGTWARVLGRVGGPAASRLVGALEAIDALRTRSGAPRDFWNAYNDVLRRVGLDEGAGSKSYDVWLDVVDELGDALACFDRWAGPDVGWRAEKRMLLEAIGSRRVPVGRTGRGVSVMTPRDARHLRFRKTVVIGLSQGALDVADSAAAVFGDRERRALNEALESRIFRSRRDRSLEGSLLLAERIQSTAEDALLLYPTENASGQPLLAALEWDALRKTRGAPEPPEPEAAPGPAWRSIVTADEIARLQEIEKGRHAFFAREPAARRGSGGAWDGTLGPEAVLLMVADLEGGMRRWTATRLEMWRECPQRFFQRYVLGLAKPDEQPLEPRASALGTAVHSALESLVLEPGGPPNADDVEAALLEAGKRLGEVERGDPEIWRLTIRRVAGILGIYLRHVHEKARGSSATPTIFELAFGLAGGVPAVALETAFGNVELAGRLDRLDVDDDGRALRVIDYKYSATRKEHREAVDPEVAGRDRFQLYAYFLGALEWAASAGLELPVHLSGTIHCIRQPGVLGPLEAPAPEIVRAAIRQTIEHAMDGRYDPSPRDLHSCKHCDFRRSCRIASASGRDAPTADSEDVS